MAKKTAKKKSAARKSSVKSLPAKMPVGNSCCGSDCNVLLCKIALIAAVFFVMSLIPRIGLWVIDVSAWVWLVIAIIFGWKPLMKVMKKK